MKICGACERELPDDSYSEEQRDRRQSIRRCEDCVAAGKQLVLMKAKGRRRTNARSATCRCHSMKGNQCLDRAA